MSIEKDTHINICVDMNYYILSIEIDIDIDIVLYIDIDIELDDYIITIVIWRQTKGDRIFYSLI